MEQEEVLLGKNPIIEALKSGRDINKIWIAEGVNQAQIQNVLKLAKERGVVTQYVPRKKMDQLVSGNHQGLIAFVAAYKYAQLSDLFNLAKERNEAPFFLILDEIEDPHNLGSIIRTADATGVHGVIIPKRRAVGLTGAVAKTSAGGIEYVPVCRVTNLARTIEELKEQGLWIMGTDASGKQDFREMDGSIPLAIVIGSEGKGVSRLVRDNCDFLFKLPMKGEVTSLNASVAAGILMYEVFRKRYPIGE